MISIDTLNNSSRLFDDCIFDTIWSLCFVEAGDATGGIPLSVLLLWTSSGVAGFFFFLVGRRAVIVFLSVDVGNLNLARRF